MLKTQDKEFVNVLFNKKIKDKMKRIQSKLRKIDIHEVFKIFLSCFDDKRYILDDGIIVWVTFMKRHWKLYLIMPFKLTEIEV